MRLLALLLILSACSVDANGLDGAPTQTRPFVRGAPDVPPSTDFQDSGEVDQGSPQPDVGLGGPDVPPTGMPDASSEDTGRTVSTDGGASDGNPSTDDASVTDTGVVAPPSECPIDSARSLTWCDALTELCRYPHGLMVGCTAEGRLCVQSCP